MKKTGQIMTMSGVGLTGISIILFGVSWEAEGGSWLTTDNAVYVVAGAFIGGIITTVIGIPLWAVGSSRKTKAEITLQNFEIKPENSMALGVGITLRF